MIRSITGWSQDDEDHWVAALSCGHTQHVRHIPPMQERPWVLDAAAREEWLGRDIECSDCDLMRADHPPLELATPQIAASAFIAEGTHIHGDVHIAADAVIMFGVVMRAEFDRIRIGERTNVQDNSVIHADAGKPCVVGDDVTVGHMAMLHGATIADHCLVGIGARALNGSTLGEGAWLAAGSLLPEGKEIPPWTLALGVPAKPVRDLLPEEVERQRSGVGHYLQLGATYREETT